MGLEMPLNFDEISATAVRCHREGRLSEAIEGYRLAV
jgi:hypothetical protein